MKIRKLVTLLATASLVSAMALPVSAKDVSDYTDVHETDWFYAPVADISAKEWMTGTSGSAFAPADSLSRAQLAVILYRMAGSPETAYEYCFPDVSDGQFYSEATTWAYDNGVISGYNDGRFGPADGITREQLATMLYRYMGKTGGDTSTSGDIFAFPDGSRTSGFAVDAMRWAVGSGIITGEADGRLNPTGGVSRAVCATMISRLTMQAVTEHEHNWISSAVWGRIQTIAIRASQCACGHRYYLQVGNDVLVDTWDTLEEHAVAHILAGEDDGYSNGTYLVSQTVSADADMSDRSDTVSYSEPGYAFSEYAHCNCGETQRMNRNLDKAYDRYGSLLENTILYNNPDLI